MHSFVFTDGTTITVALSKWGKDATKTFQGTPVDPLAYMWRLLLQSATANPATKDKDLFQGIKDATGRSSFARTDLFQ
jgi:hypothetical protein